MAQTTIATVQAALKAVLDALVAVDGTPLTGIPVIVQTFQNLRPEPADNSLDTLLKAALEKEGMAFLIALPGGTARDAAENAANFFNCAPVLELHLNPTRLFKSGTDSLKRDPLEVLDHLLPRLIAPGDVQGPQRWHLGNVPFERLAKSDLGLFYRINLTLPMFFKRTP